MRALGNVLSRERLERYRQMTPSERWREVEALMDEAWRALQALPPGERERRLALIRAQHDESDRIVHEHLLRHG
jgi:hypothetical protein